MPANGSPPKKAKVTKSSTVPILHNDGDRNKFLNKLSIAAERLQLKIHAYVLMSNHYHLLIETPQANITKAMHDINAGYANWYRHKYRLIGSIFQGRY